MDIPRTAALAACLVLSLGACSSGGSPSPTGGATPVGSSMAGPATSPSAALCADVTALRTSVDSLTTVNLAPGITEELKSDLADVEARLSAVVSDARGRWQAETDAVVAALATLEAVVRTAAASPGTGGASNIRVAVEGLRASVQNLLTVVRPACPSVAPSLSG